MPPARRSSGPPRFRGGSGSGRGGFSLIEVVISMAVIALLSVFIIPRAMQLVDKMAANRLASELSSVRTSVNLFLLRTGTYPQYLSQLSNPISTGDLNANFRPFSQRQIDNWNGPYIDMDLPADLGWDETVKQLPMRAQLLNQLICYDLDLNEQIEWEPYCPPGSFVAIVILGLYGYQFDMLNLKVDGDETSDVGFGRRSGKLRYYAADGIDVAIQAGLTYYFIGPWDSTR